MLLSARRLESRSIGKPRQIGGSSTWTAFGLQPHRGERFKLP